MSTRPCQFTARLADKDLDIVGDVHGELAALQDLVRHLGYDADGVHGAGRRLVFVGDLCDRGPDSPGVLRFVQRLVANGQAQCVLGNHELNLLRDAPKTGNGWFFADDHDRRAGKFRHCNPAADGERGPIRAFLASLPLALMRDDLRVIHAAWHPDSLRALDGEQRGRPLLEVYRKFSARAEQAARDGQLHDEARREDQQWASLLSDEHTRVPLLPARGQLDELCQMSNPVRVLTSGVERLAEASFYASGKWRMVDRVAWWADYHDDVPVVFGHYWRWADQAGQQRYSRGERNLFAGEPVNGWVGPRRNAFCVDFSVGVRYRERPLAPGDSYHGRLAALRWPQRELVFDDGERLPLRG